ncbi:MAG: endonuclease III [Armatimonadota bacterium]
MMDNKSRLKKILEILEEQYPDAMCTLDFKTPHQLMVAAILAAQSTDKKVNEITPALFEKYPDVYAFAEADQTELEEMVKQSGFYRQKAKSIIESAREIVARHNGVVPDNIDDLIKLSGIGRKTANLIIGDAYGKPAVIVDTHVKRISNRLGLTTNENPDKIEDDLRQILSEEDSTHFNHLIVALGRDICKAPKPKCEICRLIELCPYGQQNMTSKSLGL